MSFERPGLCLASAAAFGLGDVATARLVRAALPADPHAIVLVGFGAVVMGPATLFTGLAAWTLGDADTARRDFLAAEALVGPLGWKPWAEAARALVDAVDHPDGRVDLPLGLWRP